MTPEERAAARARCEKATPGAWEADPMLPTILGMSDKYGEMLTIVRTEPVVSSDWAANRDFIAHARTDLPAALDYIEVLEKALREQLSFDDYGSRDPESVEEDIRELQARAKAKR